MKVYSQGAVDKLFKKWTAMDGEVETIGEGCLLSFDIAILTKRRV